MAKTELTRELLEAAVLGASILGGGGGGTVEEALDVGDMALKIGPLHLVDPDDLDPAGDIVTCSTVTCHYSKDSCLFPRARVRSVELLLESGIPRPSGLIPNECGTTGIVNGWIEGAILGIPLVDAPCNGRAHPTPEMGSMGLHLLDGYISSQSFAGGSPAKGTYIEGILRGSVGTVSNMIRQDACVVGGILAVARNPVSAAFVKENGAPGAVKQAIRIGAAMKGAEEKGPDAIIGAAAELLSATVIRCGSVGAVDRFTAGGIDTGTAFLGAYEVTFWKEYMTLEKDGERIATFPDLITILDGDTGRVVPTGSLRPGMNAVLLTTSRRELVLGGGMRSPGLFEPAETILGKPILPYLNI